MVDVLFIFITVLYNLCFSYSCGYRKVFDDYAQIIHQKYPEISIQGGNYDPPGYHMFLAKALVSDISDTRTIADL